MIKNQIYLTPQLKSKITRDYHYELDRKARAVIKLFPELNADRLEIGLVTTPFYFATAKTSSKGRIKICVNPVYLTTHYTLGHELTHFVQHLDVEGKIPYGEVQCDVWTLARDEIFLDAVPCYLKFPKLIHDNWGQYSKPVHKLCIDAIEIRKTQRKYLKWLEQEIMELGE